MSFIQSPPELGNQYRDDRVLGGCLAHALPPEVLRDIEAELDAMGELAGGALYRSQLADRQSEPRLTRWDAWGNRIDRIDVTPQWREAEALAVRFGLTALPYERRHGRYSRLHQFALVYLFTPSTDMYSCPLAMTDGAACALLAAGNQPLIEYALPHLTSRDPRTFWTSGQWMTESTGGSDVGLSETMAARDGRGQWRLSGRKWFTSAIASQMALTLARPEGNPPGGRGLALFFVETRDAQGRPNGVRVERLKDKLGTRKLPTAELTLEAAPVEPVAGLDNGVRAIAPMLNVTRTWNAVCAVSYMRRGLALARDYARKRVAFDAPLADKPLHVDTLAGLQAEFEAALHLALYVVELLGRAEAGEAGEQQHALLRVLTPVAKLTTARQAVALLSEVVEAFGGAGYVEDTGIPALLRDAQVFSIWEGTTNVLALDALRGLGGDGAALLEREVGFVLQGVREASLLRLSALAQKALERAQAWLQDAMQQGEAALEAGARRLALTLGRSLALALLARHAQWALDRDGDARPAAAARRFAAAGIDLCASFDQMDARALANDTPVTAPAFRPAAD